MHCTDICKINWGFLASLYGNTCYFPTDNGVLEMAMPRWVFGVWTWKFDTWSSSSSSRHSKVDDFFFQPTYGRPNGFPDPQIEEKCTFFFSSTFWVSWWAPAKSRVKISGLNSQNWAGHSDISKIMASWPAQLVIVLHINPSRYQVIGIIAQIWTSVCNL